MNQLKVLHLQRKKRSSISAGASSASVHVGKKKATAQWSTRLRSTAASELVPLAGRYLLPSPTALTDLFRVISHLPPAPSHHQHHRGKQHPSREALLTVLCQPVWPLPHNAAVWPEKPLETSSLLFSWSFLFSISASFALSIFFFHPNRKPNVLVKSVPLSGRR